MVIGFGVTIPKCCHFLAYHSWTFNTYYSNMCVVRFISGCFATHIFLQQQQWSNGHTFQGQECFTERLLSGHCDNFANTSWHFVTAINMISWNMLDQLLGGFSCLPWKEETPCDQPIGSIWSEGRTIHCWDSQMAARWDGAFKVSTRVWKVAKKPVPTIS